jgi:anti-sigma regulatory factor (Ser/Thr protein kinase)
MPTELPVVTGVELAARYVPSGGLEVGGDWYDVLNLPDGGTALVMGDVEGHDSAAAAIMGQVRTVLNTYVAEGYPPTEVLARTSNFVNSHTDRLVTCCYAELRPEQRTLTWVSAGHPAPVLLDPHRGARELPAEIGMVLGWEDDPRYLEHTIVLPDGACLMLVTDGLLDVLPGVMYNDLDSLAEAAAPALGRPIEDLADRLVQHRPGTPALRDDAALLLARLTPTSRRRSRRATRVFGPYPSACVAARTFTRDLLAAWRIAPLASDAELAVSELVTNALTHTTSPIRLTLRSPGSGEVWIGVHDTSDRQPSAGSGGVDPEAIGGRGLLIVNELASAWGVIPSPRRSGKTVWAELTTTSPR